MNRNFEYINANQLDSYYGMQQVVIIDLRNPAEYERGHFASAINIPYARMEAILENMGGQNRSGRQEAVGTKEGDDQEQLLDKRMIYVFYCERGSLSMMICSKMAARGFQVKTVVGGIRRYRGRNMR